MTKKELLIFDLDGTLLNTIADLATSTNYALKKCNFPTHDKDAYRFFVGNGINKLFERALPEEARNESNILTIRKHFLEYYEQHNSELTIPYPGVTELLEEAQKRGVKLAVASNKYHQGTVNLITYFFPTIEFVAILGQRDGISPKPNPIIVNDILAASQVDKENTLYIGDSGVDMQTAINSGVDACGVCWGFRPRKELEAFQPKYIVENTKEILDILGFI